MTSEMPIHVHALGQMHLCVEQFLFNFSLPYSLYPYPNSVRINVSFLVPPLSVPAVMATL